MIEKKHQKIPDSNYKFRPHMIYIWIMFPLSFLPVILAVIHSEFLYTTLNSKIPFFKKVESWYSSRVEKVEEMRVLAPFPDKWDGPWYALDKNYANFDKWFNDNMGLRDFFIRSKNELDYRIFRSSSRVYYGSDNYIFGRNLIDNELPATESVMASVTDRNSIINGMKLLSERLQKDGVTTYFVTPMQKEYFIDNKLPFFAPKIPQQSNFMSFYKELVDDSGLNVIDVYELIKSVPKDYRTFYSQDFHWTHLSAFMISKDIVNKIADKEKSLKKWDEKFEVINTPFLGSDARFSSRLIAQEHITEPTIKKSWVDIHNIYQLNIKQTGLEFETDLINDKKLLPETCMYGNSFSDGMLDVGIVNFFNKFTKVDRNRSVLDIPKLIKGRCKYLIIQILDIQPNVWSLLKKNNEGY
ncbi:hypothetical protein N5580_06205 [Pantoea piersonii]|uniref:AlgX/AlgJ SGNH hydrolase-like domain-containing protein n=1 Tax=Pantoea piersonii TaxID=2364647 RepID=A0AAJ5QKF4_9GAMM|nr:hypothetical protein [Pantoea piersonii]WBG92127.1 hypothetical protein N5580_06205 [Pantoea piersonii]